METHDSGKVVGPVWFSGIASASTVGLFSEAPTYLEKAAPFYPVLQTNYEFNKILDAPFRPRISPANRKGLFFPASGIIFRNNAGCITTTFFFCVFMLEDKIWKIIFATFVCSEIVAFS